MQNLRNLKNLQNLQRGSFSLQPVISFLTSLVNSNGGVYFPFQENASEGAELLTDGNMEADNVDAWTANASTLTKETSDPQSGTRNLRVTWVSSSNVSASQTIMTVGKRYRVTGYFRGSGSGDVVPRILDGGTQSLAQGTISNSWQSFDVEFVAENTELFLRAQESDEAGEWSEFDNISIIELTNDSGDVALAVNPALDLGRDLVINGDFANWTTDDPDDWVVTEVGDATSNITEDSGKVNLISDGTSAQIQQTILEIGKTYTATMDVIAASGSIKWGSPLTGAAQEVLTTTGAKTFSFTADHANFVIKRDGACNFTIDNVTVKQTNILASTHSDFDGSEELSEEGDGTADKDNWIALSSAVLTNPSAGILRLTRNAEDDPGMLNDDAGNLTVGKRYKVSGEARSDGNAIPKVIQGNTKFTGTTSMDWQPFDVEFEITSINIIYRAETAIGTEFAEFRNLSITEVNPLNGDIIGAFIDQSAGSKLKKSYLFDGVNDFVDIYSAEINSIFDPTKGTLLAFAKVSDVGVWGDGDNRTILNLGVDVTDNRVVILKTTVSNQLRFRYEAAGTDLSVFDTSLGGSIDFFMVAITWDTGADKVKAYINGVQVGSDLDTLGTWVGNFDSTRVLIGAGTTTPVTVWDGNISHPLLLTEVLSASDILRIARLGGVA